MIPLLGEKVAEFLTPMVAKVSSPFIKWGLILGAFAIVLAVTNWKTYDYMRTSCEDEKVEAVRIAAQQAAEIAREQLLGMAVVNQKIAEDRDEKARTLEQYIDKAKRQARKYEHITIQIPADVLAIHDEYVRMSNPVPSPGGSSDSRATGAEVSGRTLSAEAESRVRDAVGDSLAEMTLENVVLMLADTYKTLGRMATDYQLFTEWNDGREKTELKR